MISDQRPAPEVWNSNIQFAQKLVGASRMSLLVVLLPYLGFRTEMIEVRGIEMEQLKPVALMKDYLVVRKVVWY